MSYIQYSVPYYGTKVEKVKENEPFIDNDLSIIYNQGLFGNSVTVDSKLICLYLETVQKFTFIYNLLKDNTYVTVGVNANEQRSDVKIVIGKKFANYDASIILSQKIKNTLTFDTLFEVLKIFWIQNFKRTSIGPSWQNVGTAGFSAGEVLYTSIVVDNNNTLYIAYQDKANGNGISVEGFIAGKWDYISSAGFISPVTFTTLAIDKNNLKYVSFSDTVTTQAGKVSVMKYVDATKQWAFVGARGFSTGALTEPASLAISPSLSPHIAYKDSDGKAIVKKFNGTAWENVGTTTSAAAATYVKLAISSDNTIYIAYADGSVGNKATVLKFNGTAWVVVGFVGFSPGEAKHVALKLDKNNVPYIAFRDETYAGKVIVMKFNGIAWVIVGNPGFGADGVDYLGLVIDSNGVPYVGFNDLTYINKLTVMKFDGTTWWVIVGTAGFSAGQPTNLSMSIDNNDVPYCGYRDFGTDKKATVMRYL